MHCGGISLRMLSPHSTLWLTRLRALVKVELITARDVDTTIATSSALCPWRIR